MVNIRVYRLDDGKFLEDFSVGNYIGNQNDINNHVSRIKKLHGCEVFYK
jgi:hypothetical protein